MLVQKNQVDFAVTVDTEAQKLRVNVRARYDDTVYFCVYKHYGEESSVLKAKAFRNTIMASLCCKGEPVLLKIYVIHSKKRYLKHHCRYFIELLEEQFSVIGGEKLKRFSKSDT